MDPERWQQVARIYDGAAERPASERSAYLAHACGDDEPLRREVESLLDQEGTPVLIDRPALESAKELLQSDAALPPGTRLGPYQVEELIGSGGMGHVYRAIDTRLNRTVAIKVLADAAALDPGSRERFEREGRAIASLTHPHICTVHDVGQEPAGESGTVVDFLVMEYVEGETLSARLARGALPLDESLGYAIQIASALDKAHREGIVHRDLTPGNVMLTKSGAKLLDFGLAKIAGPKVLGGVTAAPHPAGAHLTSPGTVLGTFQYMAPEQLEGQDADARTDIFALGTVVYEMLTGAKAFQGKSQASLIGAIMHTVPPPVSTGQPLSPPALDRVISTCLAKDPDARWQNAGDLTRELRWIAGAASPERPLNPTSGRLRGFWPRSPLAWGAVSVLLLAALLVIARAVATPPAPDLRVTRFAFAPPDGWSLTTGSADPQGNGVAAAPIAVSHDGRRIAYAAVDQTGGQRIWIRALENLESQPVNGTERGSDPFWSPDDRFLGFFADGKLKKVTATEVGSAVVLSDASDAQGGSWSADGSTIVFSSTSVIQRIPATGGVPVSITQRDSAELAHARPVFLPDSRHFLYYAIRPAKQHALILASLDSGARTQLMAPGAMSVGYSRGHLLFVQGTSLMAQRFDANELAIIGQPFPVATPSHTQAVAPTVGAFSASDSGVLVYQSETGAGVSQLMGFDRSGRVTEQIGEPAAFTGVSISPDGRRLGVGLLDGPGVEADIWLYDRVSGRRTRLTSGDAGEGAFTWSPDGQRIAFSSPPATPPGLILRSTDGSARDQTLPLEPANASTQSGWQPIDWSPDGRLILAAAAGQLWIVPVDRKEKPSRWGPVDGTQAHGRFDPSGRWIAYQSTRRGTTDIYVASFPTAGPTWQVSTQGGSIPRWRPDGREIFYIAPDGGLMAAPVSVASGRFEVGDVRPLFPLPRKLLSNRFGSPYDVWRDGNLIIANTSSPQTSTPPSITVVLNWVAHP